MDLLYPLKRIKLSKQILLFGGGPSVFSNHKNNPPPQRMQKRLPKAPPQKTIGLEILSYLSFAIYIISNCKVART